MKSYLIGEVSCNLHRAATYVRVQVFGKDDIPLSIKATRGDFSRDLFTRGTIVKIERSDPNDARRYHVVDVYKSETGDEDDWCCECEPTTSSDKLVRFFLGSRYFNEMGQAQRMGRVLTASFGITYKEAARITHGLGSWITCREEQFARFLINRDAAGIPNGFQDLRVEYVDAPPQRVFDVSDRDR